MPEAMRAELMRIHFSADATFFDASLGVQVILAPQGMRRLGGNDSPDDAPREHRMGGGGMGGPGMGGGRMGGGPPPGGMRGGDGASPMPRSSIRASNLPPLQLQLSLTNHGTNEITVEVLDFNSALGNFVTQPDTFTIAAGQTAVPAPMISRLGIPGDEIPLTIRLRRDNRTEQQVLILKQSEPPPPSDS